MKPDRLTEVDLRDGEVITENLDYAARAHMQFRHCHDRDLPGNRAGRDKLAYNRLLQ